MIDIYDILKEDGYNVDTIDEDKWDDLQTDFEDECDDYLVEAINNHRKTISFEWASKLNLKKAHKKT